MNLDVVLNFGMKPRLVRRLQAIQLGFPAAQRRGPSQGTSPPNLLLSARHENKSTICLKTNSTWLTAAINELKMAWVRLQEYTAIVCFKP
jgi:hypothetical protein